MAQAFTPQAFQAKWRASRLKERSAYQEHFLDLCRLLGQPSPASVDHEGSFFTFEKGAHKSGGGDGFADVWLRHHFAWEYKGKHKDLDIAYQQLLQYREDLENPPLLVVCDFERYEVHTNFTNCEKKVYRFTNEELDQPEPLRILRALFQQPETLKPRRSTREVTEEAAAKFTSLAEGLRERGIEPHAGAHFLMKLIFCMFAEDVGLLKDEIFKKIVKAGREDPETFARELGQLFGAMAKGGRAFLQTIDHFNGGLFDGAAVLELTEEEIGTLEQCCELHWGSIEPAIFGTLFERLLDPAKRSQLGAHYTGREDILTLVEPVLMRPLRREWEEAQAAFEAARGKRDAAKRAGGARKKAEEAAREVLDAFMHRLSTVKVLDPACGSGNFLYVALNLLMDLEKEVYAFGQRHQVELFRLAGPQQLHGIEINPYARELAQLVVWIGYIQWDKNNGFVRHDKPILKPLDTIREMDAILDLTDPKQPAEPKWPKCDVIVGNPPFLGGKKMRTQLGNSYMDTLFKVYKDRVPHEGDLFCYWFEKARTQVEMSKCKRAGLLASQAIRGGANREVLKRIKETGDIFFAVSDREWILDGANVHISMVGFDGGDEKELKLDGQLVEQIDPTLSSAEGNVGDSKALKENLSLSFMGVTPAGRFDLAMQDAVDLLKHPNPNGRPNSDVLRPYVNGADITGRNQERWIIDFGVERSIEQAVLYENPFRNVKENVYPIRSKNAREGYRKKWWLFAEARTGMRTAFKFVGEYIATSMVAKHRLYVRLSTVCLPANLLIVFARSDDYLLGMLQSRVHEVWALKLGTRLETRPRYTPTTCFETFPFPEGGSPQETKHYSATGRRASLPSAHRRIAEAAGELDTLRNNWLNPPEWTREEALEFRASEQGPWARHLLPGTVKSGIGTARYARLVPKNAACAEQLAKRTLTSLYNQRPEWLAQAHRTLDEAVFAAYGWPATLSDDELLARLLALNLARAGKLAAAVKPKVAARGKNLKRGD